MGKYNTGTVSAKNQATGPVRTKAKKTTTTHEGKVTAKRDARSELFLAAVSTLGDSDFYESAKARETRVAELARKIGLKHPEWTLSFITYLRDTAQIRSTALVVAVEAADARSKVGIKGDTWGRKFVSAALSRADEPGEAIAYYLARHGKKIPAAVKKGVADAASRLYTEYSVLKYDTDGKAVRFGDVVQLAHVKMANNDLVQYILNRRYGNDEIPESLSMVRARKALMDLPADERVKASPEELKAAGLTWESRSSWGPMGAKAWGDLIMADAMGYMALIRNLRNFTEANIAPTRVKKVRDILADPERVRKSRQLPFRFFSAYKATKDSVKYHSALEEALEVSLENIPELPGRTLVLVDTSGSMFPSWGGDMSDGTSKISRMEQAALFGTAVALRAESATLVQFGSSSEEIPFRKGDSVLALMNRYKCLGGTSTAAAVKRHFKKHDRVIIVTDEQYNGYGSDPTKQVPASVPVYTWNVAGYRAGHGKNGPNRHTFGGLTDHAFRLIPLLEAGQSADWETLFSTEP